MSEGGYNHQLLNSSEVKENTKNTRNIFFILSFKTNAVLKRCAQ